MRQEWEKDYIFAWSTKTSLKDDVLASKRKNKNFKKKQRKKLKS